MVFGEIVEPSSRALWEDDFVDFPEYEEPELQWSKNSEVPNTVNKLFIGETSHIIELLQKCVLDPIKPCCELLKTGILVYKIESDSYVITYKAHSDIIVGKITEKLIPWLKAARDVYVLTSGSLTLLQNCVFAETSHCIIRQLSNKSGNSSYQKLEVPNLVTGLSASILTYCIHRELTCTLYISYFEEVPLDSLNSQLFVDLLRYLAINPLRGYTLTPKLSNNNLYM